MKIDHDSGIDRPVNLMRCDGPSNEPTNYNTRGGIASIVNATGNNSIKRTGTGFLHRDLNNGSEKRTCSRGRGLHKDEGPPAL